MSTEKLVRITIFARRKEGISEDDFDRYWATNHGPLISDWLLRNGIVKYVQYHLTQDYRKLSAELQVNGSNQKQLPYDCLADFYVRKFEDFKKAFQDPEYLEKIRPDELKFVNPDTFTTVVGFDHVVIENAEKVTVHHHYV